MIKIRAGLYFADNLYGNGDLGEVVGKVEGGRWDGKWEVRWHSGNTDHTFETDQSITDMIKGEV